jgi:hypothetical protein
VIARVLASEPTMTELAAPRTWMLHQAGTLIARHRDNLQLKTVGRVEIDRAKFDHFFPDRGIPIGPVINDVTVSNSMTSPARETDDPFWDDNRMALRPCIGALSDIKVGTGARDEARRNLSRRWRGQYSYDEGVRERASFLALLKEVSGLLRGSIDEGAGATDRPGRPLDAVIEGRRDGRGSASSSGTSVRQNAIARSNTTARSTNAAVGSRAAGRSARDGRATSR